MLMHHLLIDGAARTPDKIALRWVDRNRALTFAQSVSEMEKAAGALGHCGIKPGDRVTIFAHNGLDYLTALFACWRIGAIAALVNVKLAEDLAYYLGDHRPKAIIYTHDMRSAVFDAAPAAPGLKTFLCMDGPQEGALSWPELVAAGFAPPVDPADEGAIAHLSYTSGSTGKPKGACLAHEPTMRATNCIAERLRLNDEDVSFGPTALSSSYQLVANLLPPLHRGATVNVMGRWTQETGLAAMREADASLFVANPILLAEVLEEARKGVPLPPRLRAAVSGGAPVPPALKKAWRDELNLPLCESYGQSELGGFVALGGATLPADDALTTIGLPLPDKEVRIFDLEGRECATGEAGELCLRGGFMKGYWDRPDKTAEALRGGWLHTGDAGFKDDKGRITMRGRFSELLTVAGRTWFPRDVEEAFNRLAGVKDAALVGVKTADGSHSPVVFVLLHEGASPGGLITAAQGHCTYDLTPLALHVLPAFPMTPTGKIAKMELITLAENAS